MEINEIFRFADFLSYFPTIKRANKIKGKNDFENDSEHCYQLAMVSWYVAELFKLNLNLSILCRFKLNSQYHNFLIYLYTIFILIF